jgi:mono/diheme cytochrome c family protein
MSVSATQKQAVQTQPAWDRRRRKRTWWRWPLVGSCLLSISYYAQQRLSAAADPRHVLTAGVTEQALNQLGQAPTVMAHAAKLFTQFCAACHGTQAEGLVGPNLTDAYWLHGDASLMALYSVIGQGVESKGMPAWNRQLKPIEIAELAAFLGTLRDTNLAGPKGHEGRLVVRPAF